MADTSAGFRPIGTLSGYPITYADFLFKDNETLTIGDIGNNESGEVDLGATNDTKFIGVVQETKTGVDSTTLISVTTNRDIIMAVYDPVARSAGDFLDLSGATGAQTIAAASNNDFIVYQGKAATIPETLVIFASGEHMFDQ